MPSNDYKSRYDQNRANSRSTDLSWGDRSDGRSNRERNLEGERLTYAQSQGYGRSGVESGIHSRAEMNEFERGRKASRDYDSNYTGYRREPDYGGEDFGPYTPYNSYNEYDGRNQGYRTADAEYRQTSHSGKGPKGWKRTDERIKDDVCEMLERDHVVDASEIEVTVTDGIVTLSGHVETRPTKRRAEDLIENISGVKDVRNEISINQSLFQQAKDFILGESRL